MRPKSDRGGALIKEEAPELYLCDMKRQHASSHLRARKHSLDPDHDNHADS